MKCDGADSCTSDAEYVATGKLLKTHLVCGDCKAQYEGMDFFKAGDVRFKLLDSREGPLEVLRALLEVVDSVSKRTGRIWSLYDLRTINTARKMVGTDEGASVRRSQPRRRRPI